MLTGWQIVTSENINGVTTVVKPYSKYTLSHDVTDKKFSAFYNNTVIKAVPTPKAGEWAIRS